METMKVDEKVILNAFGVRDIEATIAAANDQLLPNEKAHKTTVLYEDLWRDVDSTTDRKSTRLNSSHVRTSRMPSSA